MTLSDFVAALGFFALLLLVFVAGILIGVSERHRTPESTD